MRYLRTWFALDFISVFPFDVVIEAVLSATDPTYADSSSHSTARLTRLVRLTRLPRLLRLFKFLRARRFLTSWSHPGLLAPSVWRLMMLMMWVMILVHVVACVLHFIHETEVTLIHYNINHNTDHNPNAEGEGVVEIVGR